MARRKRRGWDGERGEWGARSWEDADFERGGRARRRKSRRDDVPTPPAAMAVEDHPKPRPVTCQQCSHLVITRSMVKLLNQGWERAISFPTFTCFEQRWTLEDPESAPNPGLVTEYLVDGADSCPSFARGYPRDHRW